MNAVADSRLVAALDLILPGGAGFPPASAVNLADWVGGQPRFAPAIAWLLGRLADGFDKMPASAGYTALEALEAEDPERFGAVVIAAYSGYYTHPDVLAVIEAERGYKARPPQPGGYDLAAFDDAILAVPRARPPSYRDPKKETGA